MRKWPYSPGDTIKSANDNADKEGLASGENDYDNNSIFVFRREAFPSFFAKGGSVWAISSGRAGVMSSGHMYTATTGDRISIAGVGSYVFSATQDTYVFVNVSSGVLRYAPVSVGATAPTMNADEVLNAVITTDSTNITSILQAGMSNTGALIYNTSPFSTSVVPILRRGVNAATISPTLDCQIFAMDSLAQNTTIGAPTGTPADGQGIMLRIKDNGTAKALAWNAVYKGVGVTLPTSTTAGKMMYVFFRRNSPISRYDVLSIGREA